MKKVFYLLVILFLFFISFDDVFAVNYRYYDKKTDVLIVSPYALSVTQSDEIFEGYDYNYDIGEIYSNDAAGIYMIMIARYPLNYKNFEAETSFSKEEMNGGIKNDGYAVSKGYIIELYSYCYMIATYDDKNYYVYVMLVEEENDKYEEQFIDMVINSSYQYSKLNQNSTEQDDSSINSGEQDKPIIDSNESDTPTTDSNQPPESYYDKIVISADDIKLKNFLLKVGGSLFFVIVGIVMITKKKFKISFVNLFGIFIVLSTLVRALIDDNLLFTADKLEIIYLVLFFIPSVVGLYLISKEKYIDKSNDVINKIIDSSKNTLSQPFNEQSTQQLNHSQIQNINQTSNQSQQSANENSISNVPVQETKQQTENVVQQQNSNVKDNVTVTSENSQKLISVEELMNQTIIPNDKDKI